MYTLGCRFVSRRTTVGQLIFGQHTNHFHNPRILSNAVPLGFFFFVLAFPPPSVTIRERRLSLRRAIRPLRRVRPKGATRFYPNGLRRPLSLP